MKIRFVPIVLLLSASGAAGPAAADGIRGIYGGIAGGGNHVREGSDGASALDFEDGGLGSVSLGYAFESGLRPEVEYALRSNDAQEAEGSVEANGAMGNLWYDFGAPGFAPRLRPYIGGGAGRAEVSFEEFAGSAALGDVERNVTAYQAGAGIDFDATRHLVLSVGYRFLETEKARFIEGSEGTPGTLLEPGTPAVPAFEERYRSDGVLAGLRYTFGGREPTRTAAAEPLPEAEVAAFETVVLRPVNFQLDRAELTPPSRQTLDELAARLKQHPDMTVTIEGHADSTGAEPYNRQLGQRRAEAVRGYLVGRGVKADRLQVASAGEGEPVADNASTEGRAQNRRAEVVTQDASGQRVKIVIEGPSEASVDAAKEPQ